MPTLRHVDPPSKPRTSSRCIGLKSSTPRNDPDLCLQAHLKILGREHQQLIVSHECKMSEDRHLYKFYLGDKIVSVC